VLAPEFFDEGLHLLHLVAVLDLLLADLPEDVLQVGLRVLEGVVDPAQGIIGELEVLIDEVLEESLVGLHEGLDARLDLGGELVGAVAVPDPLGEVREYVIEGLKVLRILDQTALLLEIRPLHECVEGFLVLDEHPHGRLERAHNGRKVGDPRLQLLVLALQLAVLLPVALDLDSQLRVLLLQDVGLQLLSHPPPLKYLLNSSN
jgi:hypothetical protein